MKTILLSILLVTLSTAGFCTVHVITRSGNNFVPSTLTITNGDSVNFQLSIYHNVIEVSQATWNANGTAPLPGFSLPLGGGMVLPAQLTTGTHYYVCGEHATTDTMKGIIIVQNPAGIEKNQIVDDISVFPNPSCGKFLVSGFMFRVGELEIYNIQGEKILHTNISQPLSSINLDVSNGIYFINIKTEHGIANKKIVVNH